MTTAPMRPTVPALRPFFDSPPCVFAGGRGQWRLSAVWERSSSCLFLVLLAGTVAASVRGTTTIGTGSSCSIFAAVEPRKSRRGWARRLEPTTASSPGSQLSWETASSMLSPRATTTSASTPSGSSASAFASTSSAWAAPAIRMTPVSTLAGRSTETSESSRSSAPVAAASARALLQQRIGAGPGADRRRDPRDAGGRVDAPRALGSEDDRQLGGVEQLAGDGSEPVAAAQPAVRGADDDVRGAELGGRVGEPFGERVAVADVGAQR